jgi:hypothetical protein
VKLSGQRQRGRRRSRRRKPRWAQQRVFPLLGRQVDRRQVGVSTSCELPTWAGDFCKVAAVVGEETPARARLARSAKPFLAMRHRFLKSTYRQKGPGQARWVLSVKALRSTTIALPGRGQKRRIAETGRRGPLPTRRRYRVEGRQLGPDAGQCGWAGIEMAPDDPARFDSGNSSDPESR